MLCAFVTRFFGQKAQSVEPVTVASGEAYLTNIYIALYCTEGEKKSRLREFAVRTPFSTPNLTALPTPIVKKTTRHTFQSRDGYLVILSCDLPGSEYRSSPHTAKHTSTEVQGVINLLSSKSSTKNSPSLEAVIGKPRNKKRCTVKTPYSPL